jgi:hypothetical protein
VTDLRNKTENYHLFNPDGSLVPDEVARERWEEMNDAWEKVKKEGCYKEFKNNK